MRMEFETMLNSIKGSFRIENMELPVEVENNIRLMEAGKKNIEDCIAETITKYSTQAS